jgi:general secretion pathway protein G
MSVNCPPTFSQAPLRRRARGFTLMELIMTGAVVGLLATIALPSYTRIVEAQRVGQARRDLMTIAESIERYRTLRGTPPGALADLGIAIPRDPWGRDYRFLSFSSPLPGVPGMIRKDHNLHPLNSEFDLYSVGKDGRSVAPLTAAASKDDVIWARDGAFVGLAADY